MPLTYSSAQSGFALRAKVGSLAEFGDLGGLSALVDGAFAFVFDVQFEQGGECVFFGADGSGTRDLRLKRNDGGVRDDSITFLSTDASGDERRVKWLSALPTGDWGRMVFNSSGAGAGTLKLFVDGVEKTISSQTNDAGFSADEVFELYFGEIESGKIQAFKFSTIYVYDRELTASEIVEITKGVFPTDYVKAYPFHRPNIGVDRSLLTPVVD